MVGSATGVVSGTLCDNGAATMVMEKPWLRIPSLKGSYTGLRRDSESLQERSAANTDRGSAFIPS